MHLVVFSYVIVAVPIEVLEHSQMADVDSARSIPMLAPIIPQQPLLRAPPLPPNMLPPPPRLPLRVPPPPPHFRTSCLIFAFLGKMNPSFVEIIV